MGESVRRILVWVEPGTWEACVSAAADLVPAGVGADVLLLYVPDDEEDLVREAQAGLWGRRRRPHPAASTDGTDLLADAEELLQRLTGDAEITRRQGSGAVERVVTAATENADYLVLGRQGDLSRRGPSSIVRHTRFVVDHARCRVVIVWPSDAPSAETIPPLPRDDPRG